MKKRLILLLICHLAALPIFTTMTVSAQDSIQIKHPKFVSFQMAEGLMLPSARIVNEETKTSNVVALNLKYGRYAKGDTPEDLYYGMPYWGIGMYKPFYSLHNELGNPFSVYLLQGATLKTFRSGASLNYEINLGVSFNWNHFDADRNPQFEALGSPVNAHLGGLLYFKKPLSTAVDLQLGVDLLHFSNGSLRTPNYGLNTVSAILGFAYHIGKERATHPSERATRTLPPFEKRTVHDLSIFATSRTVNIDTTGTRLRNKFPERRFQVVGLNYACMWHVARRFMWGPSMEMVYDEGNHSSIHAEVSEGNDSYREVVRLGTVFERFSVGLSLKGELVMPGYSIFANLGYQVLYQGNEKRFYQIYGAKVYLTEGLSASFGVKSNNLTKSQFLYISIGYSFYKYRKK